jgi:hypothetical protein
MSWSTERFKRLHLVLAGLQIGGVDEVGEHRQRDVGPDVGPWRSPATRRSGDFAGLVALLHPNAVLGVDTGGADSTLVRGAAAIAGQATRYRAPGLQARYAIGLRAPRAARTALARRI